MPAMTECAVVVIVAVVVTKTTNIQIKMRKCKDGNVTSFKCQANLSQHLKYCRKEVDQIICNEMHKFVIFRRQSYKKYKK